MKTQEELNSLKNEFESLNNKLKELSDEELTQVAGGEKMPGINDGAAQSLNFALGYMNYLNELSAFSKYTYTRLAIAHIQDAYYTVDDHKRKVSVEHAIGSVKMLLGKPELANHPTLKAVYDYLIQAQEIIGR